MIEKLIKRINLNDNTGIDLSFIDDRRPCFEFRLVILIGGEVRQTTRFLRIGLQFWQDFKDAVNEASKVIEGMKEEKKNGIQI